jgi:hypothetical protein
MTSAQCLAGAFWFACAVEAFHVAGPVGVILTLVFGALVFRALYRALNQKGKTNDV